MTKTSLKALLFDLDGVIVDSRDAIARSINHALVEHDLPERPEEELHAIIGAPLPEVFDDLQRACGQDTGRTVSLMSAYRERYVHASLVETLLYDDMPETLAVLAKRYPLAIASTKPARYTRPILETLGVLHHFDAVLGSPPLAMKAQDKAVTIRQALEALDLAPSLDGAPPVAAMIGDRLFDVHGGRSNGLWTVGVTWGAGSEEELLEAGVETLVRTPAELRALFP
jgi:phosphoglycolate phosphatase